jgi:hypothetical protein
VEKRGAELRQALGLLDEHPLKSRKLRDHLEHFDERLDAWAVSSASRNFVQDCIGPAGAISGLDPTDQMRWFDPATDRILFRGEAFELRSMVEGLEEIRVKAAALRPGPP